MFFLFLKEYFSLRQTDSSFPNLADLNLRRVSNIPIPLSPRKLLLYHFHVLGLNLAASTLSFSVKGSFKSLALRSFYQSSLDLVLAFSFLAHDLDTPAATLHFKEFSATLVGFIFYCINANPGFVSVVKLVNGTCDLRLLESFLHDWAIDFNVPTEMQILEYEYNILVAEPSSVSEFIDPFLEPLIDSEFDSIFVEPICAAKLAVVFLGAVFASLVEEQIPIQTGTIVESIVPVCKSTKSRIDLLWSLQLRIYKFTFVELDSSFKSSALINILEVQIRFYQFSGLYFEVSWYIISIAVNFPDNALDLGAVSFDMNSSTCQFFLNLCIHSSPRFGCVLLPPFLFDP